MRYLAALLILAWMTSSATAQDGDGDCANGQCQRPLASAVKAVALAPVQFMAQAADCAQCRVEARVEARQMAQVTQEQPARVERSRRPFLIRKFMARVRHHGRE